MLLDIINDVERHALIELFISKLILSFKKIVIHKCTHNTQEIVIF